MNADESDEHCGYRQDKSTLESFRLEWDSEAFRDNAQWGEDDNIVVCLRDPWTNHDRCVWHAETKDKSVDDLIAIRADGPERLVGAYLANVELGDQFPFAECWLHEANLSGALLWDADLSKACLRDVDLSGAELPGANLSGTDLLHADLSGADLTRADLRTPLLGVSLSGADLTRADLSGANLWRADLSGADLLNADLPRANLTDADLTWTDLRGADLPGANLQSAAFAGAVLGNTDLSNVKLDHRTRFLPQSLRLRLKSIFRSRFRKIGFDSEAWNKHARDAHKLAVTCSEEGLIRQARMLTIWDRHARRNEALSAGKY